MLSDLNWDFWQYFLITLIISGTLMICIKYICYTIITIKSMKITGKGIKDVQKDLNDLEAESKDKKEK